MLSRVLQRASHYAATFLETSPWRPIWFIQNPHKKKDSPPPPPPRLFERPPLPTSASESCIILKKTENNTASFCGQHVHWIPALDGNTGKLILFRWFERARQEKCSQLLSLIAPVELKYLSNRFVAKRSPPTNSFLNLPLPSFLTN